MPSTHFTEHWIDSPVVLQAIINPDEFLKDSQAGKYLWLNEFKL